MDKVVEQESLPQRKPLRDPEFRNGLIAPRLREGTELKDAQLFTWNDIQGNPTDNSDLIALLENFQTSLGYSPLRPSNNLSDLESIDESLENLGLNLGGENDIWLSRGGGAMTNTILLASLRPLMFQPAVLPTEETGLMEYDGNQLYFTPVESRRSILNSSDAFLASVTVANTTTETEVFSSTIGENGLNAGQIIKLLLFGRYSTANGADTVTIRFKVNGSTMLSLVSTAAAVTDAPLFAKFMNTIRVNGATGNFWSYLNGVINNINKHATVTSATSIDTVSEVEVSATVQWSNADAGNTISIDQALLEMN